MKKEKLINERCNHMETKQLNANQKQAVEMPLGATMVIAGPGSGKTFVITERVRYMISHLQCQPQHILVITFTKAAAEEMKGRYLKATHQTGVTFGTFHSVFYRMLRKADPNRYALERLISEDKKRQVIEKIYQGMDTGDAYEDFIEVFLGHLTLMTNQLIQPKYYNPDGISKEVFLKVFNSYEQYKERHGLFDFDDMLVHTYYLLRNDSHILTFYQSKYKHILIDEFQDINCVQFEIIKLLSSRHTDLFVVGDDDQSIYQFRGAKPEFLLSFEEYFNPVQKIILDVNYRSTPNILRYSNSLIGYNINRYEKIMHAAHIEGDKPIVTYCEDAKEQASLVLKEILKLNAAGLPLKECAIIYRTNIQARPLIEALRTVQIPFIIKDAMVTLYDQWMTKDILAYLHLAYNIEDSERLLQIINRPTRYISKLALEDARKKGGNLLKNLLESDLLSRLQKDRIEELIFNLQRLKTLTLKEAIPYIRHTIGYEKYLIEYAAYRKIPSEGLVNMLLELEDSAREYACVEEWEEALYAISMSVKQSSRQKGHDALTLTTMHSAKGLEFGAVFIIDILDGVIPHSKSLSDTQVEEERRLFYVALTRAKERLYLYIPKNRYQKKAESSPFILETLTPKITLKEGDCIKHKMYGQGKVVKLDGSKAFIRFKNGQKVVDYMYCIKHHLLSREEKNESSKDKQKR